MTKRWIIGATLAAALVMPAILRAHTGHAHKVLGTVTLRNEAVLEVKTRDGKTVTITLTDKTAIVRGKAKLDVAALKPGDRVVVDVGDGKAPLTAKEIKLGEPAAATAKK